METAAELPALLRWLHVHSWVEAWWVAFGLAGQLLFMGRFLVQWLASERAGRSVMPVAFWWFSIGGAAILLAYAIYRADPVFILGQALGFFVYVRNLMLIAKERRAAV